MTQKLKEAIKALSSLEDLPEMEQQNIAICVLNLVKSVNNSHLEPVAESKQPIWEVARELGRRIPEDELERLPTDGATEHDHYIYGTPKQHP